MSRLKLIGLCVVAALAMGSLAVASAWAQPPEIGRCVSHASGKYTNNVCTKLAKGKKVGSFEWESGAVKKKFSGTGGAGTLETVNIAQVTCKTEVSHGEFTSPTTVGNVAVTFTGCESGGFKCATVGAKEGEIVTNPLAGTLVWEKYSKKVAIDLVPQATELFAEFECGPAAAKVKGSVLTNIPANKMETKIEEKFTAKKGKQKPEYYYTSKTEKVKDVLMSKIGGPGAAYEQAGQTITNVQIDEEALEVNTVA
ncbi:MAG TPA: hypothetical protein VMB51_06335 [Solirubrobacteraceae bacterium]|nr:hypothetical protein [Solirubrobacteraceae bacterium]